MMDPWTYGLWSDELISREPSIEFLELFALVVALVILENELVNRCIVIFCNNQAVVAMVNNTPSSCLSCMNLIRILVLNGLKFNTRVSVRYVKSKQNPLADSLSRNRMDIFYHTPLGTSRLPSVIPDQMFPVEKFLSQ